jgi:membrane fusion protein, multidrug efflux system
MIIGADSMRLSPIIAGVTASAVAAAAIGLVLLAASGHEAPGAGSAPQATAMPVPVAPVIRRTVPVYLDYIGTTEAIRTVTLQAQVTGYLAKRGAPDGADVKQGELLYQIDPRDYQAALSQVKAQAQHDAAAHDYARVSQHRNSVLSSDGWVAKDTFDQTTSNLHQSEATLAADAAAIQTAADQRCRHAIQYARRARSDLCNLQPKRDRARRHHEISIEGAASGRRSGVGRRAAAI